MFQILRGPGKWKFQNNSLYGMNNKILSCYKFISDPIANVGIIKK
jgi:hypothetical protein